MLLVIDFNDLGLAFDQTDIRLNPDADFTVGKLIMKLCAGIEQIGKTEIADKGNLCLRDSLGRILDSAAKVSTLALSDWDTLILTRRR